MKKNNFFSRKKQFNPFNGNCKKKIDEYCRLDISAIGPVFIGANGLLDYSSGMVWDDPDAFAGKNGLPATDSQVLSE
jgi:hypothetical protein